VNGSAALERRYRRLLVWFPAEHRREYAEEMIGVLLASTPEGRRRPRLADAFDLMTGGLRARLRRRGAGLGGARQRDALAVCSAALPVTLLAALAVNYLWNLLQRVSWPVAGRLAGSAAGTRRWRWVSRDLSSSSSTACWGLSSARTRRRVPVTALSPGASSRSSRRV